MRPALATFRFRFSLALLAATLACGGDDPFDPTAVDPVLEGVVSNFIYGDNTFNYVQVYDEEGDAAGDPCPLAWVLVGRDTAILNEGITWRTIREGMAVRFWGRRTHNDDEDCPYEWDATHLEVLTGP